MRVEGQGMATDYLPVKSEAVSRIPVELDRSIEKKNKFNQENSNTGEKASVEAVKGAIEVVNDAMKISNFHLEFRLFEDSDTYQVKVVDNQSEKIIREIPPDYMLDLSERVQDMVSQAVGVLVDEFV